MGKEKVEHLQWLQSYYRNFYPKQINEMADTWTQAINDQKRDSDIIQHAIIFSMRLQELIKIIMFMQLTWISL